ncbi:hypothetical protein T439DRAFT_357740 [Meredithblackwellia eburnea MCA 4105]
MNSRSQSEDYQKRLLDFQTKLSTINESGNTGDILQPTINNVNHLSALAREREERLSALLDGLQRVTLSRIFVQARAMLEQEEKRLGASTGRVIAPGVADDHFVRKCEVLDAMILDVIKMLESTW